MKTTITRVKAAILNDATLRAYVREQNISIVPPRTLPPLSNSTIPFIGLAPISTPPEEWMASARKEEIHFIEAYLVIYCMDSIESVLIGVRNKRGVLDLVDDFKSAIRGNTLSDYLKKPIAIAGIDYSTAPYDDNAFLLVATVTIACTKLLNV